MAEDVPERIGDLNKQFYEKVSMSFSQTRSNPWPSWKELLASEPKSVLDCGCGNGRLLGFFNDSGVITEYIGVDNCESLLNIASSSYPDGRFVLEDIFKYVRHCDQTFDLVACFGFMHHVYGQAKRIKFIKRLASLLSPSGTLAISFWQPHKLSNFHSKVVTSHEFQLEQNDYLMNWQTDNSIQRYVHDFKDKEITELINEANLFVKKRIDGMNADASQTTLLLGASSTSES